MVTMLGARAYHEIGIFSLKIFLELLEIWSLTPTLADLVPFVAMVASLQRILKVAITQNIVWEQVVVNSLLRSSIGAVSRRTIRLDRCSGRRSIVFIHTLFVSVYPLLTPPNHVIEEVDVKIVGLAHVVQHLFWRVTKLAMLRIIAASCAW